jgi:hypothetical protein
MVIYVGSKTIFVLVQERFVLIDFHVFVIILDMFVVKEVITDEKELNPSLAYCSSTIIISIATGQEQRFI